MTQQEIFDAVEQRIRARVSGVQLRGGNGVQASGGDGRFIVSIVRPPRDLAPDVSYDPNIGTAPYTVFKGQFNNGLSEIVIGYGGAINNVYWKYNGNPLSIIPHPRINLAGGVRIYGVVTFTTSNVSLHTRADPHGPTSHWMGGTICNTAEIIVRPESNPMGDDAGFPEDPDSPGFYSVHGLLGRYKGDGTEYPPDKPEDPDYGKPYGWTLNAYPIAPFAFQAMNALAFNN